MKLLNVNVNCRLLLKKKTKIVLRPHESHTVTTQKETGGAGQGESRVASHREAPTTKLKQKETGERLLTLRRKKMNDKRKIGIRKSRLYGLTAFCLALLVGTNKKLTFILLVLPTLLIFT